MSGAIHPLLSERCRRAAARPRCRRARRLRDRRPRTDRATLLRLDPRRRSPAAADAPDRSRRRGRLAVQHWSSFAIEPMLASVADLVEEGLLPRSAARRSPRGTRARRSWPSLVAACEIVEVPSAPGRLRVVHADPGTRGPGGRPHQSFRERHEFWLEDWIAHATERCGRRRNATSVELNPDYHAFLQFVVDRQWSRLRAPRPRPRRPPRRGSPDLLRCRRRGCREPAELFRLDRSGSPSVLTGCPPDPSRSTGSSGATPTTGGTRTAARRSSGGGAGSPSRSSDSTSSGSTTSSASSGPTRCRGAPATRGSADGAARRVASSSNDCVASSARFPSSPRISATSRPRSIAFATSSTFPACGSCSGRSSTSMATRTTSLIDIHATRWSIRAPTTTTPRSGGSSRFRRRSAADSPTTRVPMPRPIPQRP